MYLNVHFYEPIVLNIIDRRHQVEKRSILDNLDLVVLCLDETVDDG